MTGHEHSIIDDITRTVAICSMAHSLLPPWEAFSDFPLAQKYYKLLIYIIGYIGLNGRSTIYRGAISMPSQVEKGTPEIKGQ